MSTPHLLRDCSASPQVYGEGRYIKNIHKKTLISCPRVQGWEALKEIKKAFWQGTDHCDELLDEKAKISGFQAIYEEIGAGKIALDKMEELHDKSVEAIMTSSLSIENKQKMIELGEIMLRRTT